MAGENKLSDKALKALHGKPQPRQKMVADGRGLSVRVSVSGTVSFVYFFRHSGRQSAPVWMTLGKYPDMTLKQAREKRDECRAWLSQGLDPRIEKVSFDKDKCEITGLITMPGKSAKRLYGSIAVMRLQEDANGDPINVIPAYILVPAALEGAANRAVLSSSSLFPVDQNGMLNQNPGIINVVKDMAQVVVEPRLDKANNKEWYVTAAQGTDTIEVAYLDGMDVPYLEQQEGFTVDGIAWKVRIDAGVAALDYRGMVKSSGAA